MDPILDDTKQEIIWKEREIKKENIVVKDIDIRNFYIDDGAITGIEDACDCIY